MNTSKIHYSKSYTSQEHCNQSNLTHFKNPLQKTFTSIQFISCASRPITVQIFQPGRSSILSIPSTNKDPHISGIIERTPLPEILYNSTQFDESSMWPTFSQMRTLLELNETTRVEFQVNRFYLNKKICKDYICHKENGSFLIFLRICNNCSKLFTTVNQPRSNKIELSLIG